MRILVMTLLGLLLAGTAAAQTKKPHSKHRPFQPVVRQDVAEYAGEYIGTDPERVVVVRSAGEGKLAVVVRKDGENVTIREPKMTGAVLTGTIKNSFNRIETFEAVFGVRDMNGRRAFGLLLNEPVKVDQDLVVNRIFCRVTEEVE